jgi:hypothetical protein
MSNRNSSNQSANRSGNQTKKFCKVCFDAGKTEAEYVSHYVRDNIGGAVVCPTILNQQCNYCKNKGHTPSHCPALEGKYKKQAQAKQPQAKPEQSQAKQPQAKPEQSQAKQPQMKAKQEQPQTRAARLCESPLPFEDKINENFPILGQVDSGKIVRPVPVKFNVWASVAAKAPIVKAPIIEEVPIAEVPIESSYIPTPVTCWADM